MKMPDPRNFIFDFVESAVCCTSFIVCCTVTRAGFPVGSNQDYKNWYSQLFCLTFIIRDNVKPPPCVVDKWTGGSLTRSLKGNKSVCL